MKGDAEVITALNELLTHELTAINQYYVHSKMCGNWVYKALAKKKMDEAMEEMRHADGLIERILLLEGVPNMQRLSSVKVGEDVIEQHKLDLALEEVAVERLAPARREDAPRGGRRGRVARDAAHAREGDRQGALPRAADARMTRSA